MSVSSQLNKHIYQGDGNRRVWAYSFDLPRDARGQPITSVISIIYHKLDGTYETRTDFTVNPTTHEITFPVAGDAPPVGSKVIALRLLPLVQLTQLQELGAFKAKTLEYSYDDLEMQIQQLNEAINRCIKAPIDREEDVENLIEIILEAKAIAIEKAAVATQKAEEASASAATASQKASEASSSAAVATAKATEATIAAASAATSAEQASNSAASAATSASSASNSAEIALSTIQNIKIWDATVEYSPPDAVMTSDGTIYRCLVTNVGQNPETSPTYWAETRAVILDAFEVDASGYLVPKEKPAKSNLWELDTDGYIIPRP